MVTLLRCAGTVTDFVAEPAALNKRFTASQSSEYVSPETLHAGTRKLLAPRCGRPRDAVGRAALGRGGCLAGGLRGGSRAEGQGAGAVCSGLGEARTSGSGAAHSGRSAPWNFRIHTAYVLHTLCVESPWESLSLFSVALAIQTCFLLKTKPDTLHTSKLLSPHFSYVPPTLQVIHGDLAHYNLVAERDGVTGKPRLSGVIDFGDVGEGWAVAELSTAIAALLAREDLPALQQVRRRTGWLGGAEYPRPRHPGKTGRPGSR